MDSTRGKKIAIGCGCAFVIVLLLVLGGFWWMIDQSFGPSSGEVATAVSSMHKGWKQVVKGSTSKAARTKHSAI